MGGAIGPGGASGCTTGPRPGGNGLVGGEWRPGAATWAPASVTNSVDKISMATRTVGIERLIWRLASNVDRRFNFDIATFPPLQAPTETTPAVGRKQARVRRCVACHRIWASA